MQHSEMCKKVEVASVEEGHENVENKNEKSVVNELNEKRPERATVSEESEKEAELEASRRE